jgi:hypothetical protein
MILYAKYGHHRPLSHQSQSFARKGINRDVSTMGDWVGVCTAATRRRGSAPDRRDLRVIEINGLPAAKRRAIRTTRIAPMVAELA